MKTEQLSEIQRKNMEAAMRLARLSIDNSQRIMALQAELARSLFDASLTNARDLVVAKTPQEAMEMRAKHTQGAAQLMMSSAQKVAEISNAARLEFSRLLTEQLASGSHELMDSFQTFFKALPGQNPDIMGAMQQAMSRANAAFEQITQVTTAAFAAGGAKPNAAKAKKPA